MKLWNKILVVGSSVLEFSLAVHTEAAEGLRRRGAAPQDSNNTNEENSQNVDGENIVVNNVVGGTANVPASVVAGGAQDNNSTTNEENNRNGNGDNDIFQADNNTVNHVVADGAQAPNNIPAPVDENVLPVPPPGFRPPRRNIRRVEVNQPGEFERRVERFLNEFQNILRLFIPTLMVIGSMYKMLSFVADAPHKNFAFIVVVTNFLGLTNFVPDFDAVTKPYVLDPGHPKPLKSSDFYIPEGVEFYTNFRHIQDYALPDWVSLLWHEDADECFSGKEGTEDICMVSYNQLDEMKSVWKKYKKKSKPKANVFAPPFFHHGILQPLPSNFYPGTRDAKYNSTEVRFLNQTQRVLDTGSTWNWEQLWEPLSSPYPRTLKEIKPNKSIYAHKDLSHVIHAYLGVQLVTWFVTIHPGFCFPLPITTLNVEQFPQRVDRADLYSASGTLIEFIDEMELSPKVSAKLGRGFVVDKDGEIYYLFDKDTAMHALKILHHFFKNMYLDSEHFEDYAKVWNDMDRFSALGLLRGALSSQPDELNKKYNQFEAFVTLTDAQGEQYIPSSKWDVKNEAKVDSFWVMLDRIPRLFFNGCLILGAVGARLFDPGPAPPVNNVNANANN